MERLKQLRTDAGMTQRDVAQLLGVDRTTYVKYENGSSDPSTATLIRLADYFGVSVDYLIGHNAAQPARIVSAPEVSGADLELLRKFHALDDVAQARILNMLDFDYRAIPQENVKSFNSLA
ncbi:MAG: helix-turn-helix domain-containing protein [Clostridiales bacterium]|nr:helix-turn-helix domain-containing protein [Clostridiales bacterium]